MKALVMANGQAPEPGALPSWALDGVDLIVAADGGAARVAALGMIPDLIVGDADSIEPGDLRRLADAGAAVELASTEKDESDLELALRAVVARGCDRVVVLGALGGQRVEHALAAIALLGLDELRGLDVAIVDERSTIRLLRADEGSGRPAATDLTGEPGDFVSLQAWDGDAVGVTTDGLRYALRDEPLRSGPSRGLSNELAGRRGRVACRGGRLLVIHTRRAALSATPQGVEARP